MEEKIRHALLKIESEFENLKNKITNFNSENDFKEYSNLLKRQKKLEPIVFNFSLFQKLENDFKNNISLLKSETNKEMIELIKEENKEIEVKLEALVSVLKLNLVPKDSLDENNVIVEIRQGVGGDEASLFGADLFRMYSKYAEKNNWKIIVLEVNQTEANGYSFISFQINGKNIYGKLKYENGGHRVQRVPKTEAKGRVHTSLVTVVVLAQVEMKDVEINQNDLRIDTYRSSGAGGQHVNTTDSAVRITHLPTNISVSSQDGRSQHDNKDRAFKALYAKLYEKQTENKRKEDKEYRSLIVKSGDRSEKVRTYNFPQNRVTDHRINLTLNKLDSIIEGNLDELINSLIAFDVQEKLITFN